MREMSRVGLILNQKFRITNNPRNQKFCKSTRPLRAIFSLRLFGLDSQQLMTSSRTVYQRIQFLCKRNWTNNNTKRGSREGLALVQTRLQLFNPAVSLPGIFFFFFLGARSQVATKMAPQHRNGRSELSLVAERSMRFWECMQVFKWSNMEDNM